MIVVTKEKQGDSACEETLLHRENHEAVGELLYRWGPTAIAGYLPVNFRDWVYGR